MTLFYIGISFFTAIVLFLVTAILIARRYLVPRGKAVLSVNEQKIFKVEKGQKLIQALASKEIYVSSACGGGGTCGQCRVKVHRGGGTILPTEKTHITRQDALRGDRLSCQVGVKQDMDVEVPAATFGAKKYLCTVESNENVACFIKDLTLKLPEGEKLDFRAGGYIQIEAVPGTYPATGFDIPETYKPMWDKFDLWNISTTIDEPIQRAYSMANFPLEDDIIKLNVRIATPPPGKKVPAGQSSSFIFSLKPGDQVVVYGPFGEFFAKETDKEMIFIGGGAGMAPMRSHIFDQLTRLKSKRKMSFWYGARSCREIFYGDEFDALAKKHKNFDWHVALSDPQEGDCWGGHTGFIHQVLYDEYLKNHEAPEDCEYYICGPPIMQSCVLLMLDSLGVEPENILFDDFGG